jgi:hypothetical protein
LLNVKGGERLNKRLIQLYEKYWDEMISSLKGNELGNPLLLHIRDEEKYKAADIKIMIFGQETNGWNGELGSKNIDELVKIYSNFLERRYGGQFWNGVRDYVSSIKEKNPDKRVEFIWNNIIKIGKDKSKGRPKQNLVDIQKEVFPVIKEEVEILQPDLIIFFTGPYYDQYIKKEWNELLINEVGHFNVKQLAMVKHEQLPINTFRTNHPTNLYFQGKTFFSEIKEIITSYPTV